MAGSSATWRAVIPALSKKYPVLAPDLQGHGGSTKPRGDYSLGAFAASLRDRLDELAISRATVIGQSLGGGVAMQFVNQHREYCERLVLIDSGGLGPDVKWTLRVSVGPRCRAAAPGGRAAIRAKGGQQAPVMVHGGRGARAAAGEMWSAYSSLVDQQTRQAFLRTLRSVVDYRGQAVSALGKIHVSHGLPTLLIWGDEDSIIPVAHGGAAHDAVPGSRLEVLPGVGHFPHVEAPTAVVDILDDFITTTAGDLELPSQKSAQY